jgi:hypothetical protein
MVVASKEVECRKVKSKPVRSRFCGSVWAENILGNSLIYSNRGESGLKSTQKIILQISAQLLN